MSAFWIASYLLLILFTGYVVVSAVLGSGPRPWWAVAGYSVTFGSGTVALLLILASMAGFKPSRAAFLLIAILGTIAAADMWWAKRLTRITAPDRSALLAGRNVWLLLPLLALASSTIVVGIHALAFPIYEWDAFAIWGLKAKVLTHQSLGSPPSYFHDPTLSFSHTDYPLLVPMLMAGGFAVIGHIDEASASMIFPLLFVAMIPMLYGGLRWRMGRGPALFLTAASLSLPVMLRWAGAAVADVPLTLFYCASINSLLRWVTKRRSADLAAAAICSAFCAMTKDEGMVLALCNCLVVLCFSSFRNRRTLAPAAWFSVAIVLLLVPGWLWRRGLPHTNIDYLGQTGMSILIDNAPRLKTIAAAFAREALRLDHWGIFWWLLPLGGILGWRAFRDPVIRAAWLLLGLHLGLYVLAFWVTPFNLQEHLANALDRLLLHTIPVAACLIGWHGAAAGSTGGAIGPPPEPQGQPVYSV